MGGISVGTWERVPMPKILKMPKPAEERRNPIATPASSASAEPAKVIPLYPDTDGDIDDVTRWLDLADQVLGNTRKKA
jgi:hypothetical protein